MRIIARLDVKNNFVIKGIQFEGLRKIGDPNNLAKKYYEAYIDEIFFIDAVASLYNRNNLFSVIEKASKEVFVPITIGGGIRSLEDIELALGAGADKVALNSAAIREPNLINQIAKQYGSQCVVASVQAKKLNNSWEAYVDGGRERTGVKVIDWVKRLQDLGAGEILLTSIDKDGTKSGFDIELVETVNKIVSIPVIVSGGFGKFEHIQKLLEHTKPSAICFATALHYNLTSVIALRNCIKQLEFD
jgi:imidazole glycerol-phosphate synthase subunit HisF